MDYEMRQQAQVSPGTTDTSKMDTTTRSIEVALRALQDAREAYNRGDLTTARRLLRFVACECEDASHALNQAINGRVEPR